MTTTASTLGASVPYITDELDRRPSKRLDNRQEMLAILELAGRMAEKPDDVLPRLVDLALELSEGASGGLSLYEETPAPGIFRWRFTRGELSSFEGATVPREASPCGVTLDQNGPVLAAHPERYYDWIADAGIVAPEVLLVPLYIAGVEPLGTLWVVSKNPGYFTRAHACTLTDLASFVSIALRMRDAEQRLHTALGEQQVLAKEMSHRLKNIFAVADGMIRIGARKTSDAKAFAISLSGRLRALASAHALVSSGLHEVGSKPRTGDLSSVIQAVVEPHQEVLGDTPRVRIRGPEIPCGDHAITALALVFHELATNAAKYGAFSRDSGFVEVSWRADSKVLELIWRERDGPAVKSPPVRKGFGGALMFNTVTGQLSGSLSQEWLEEGLCVTIVLPRDSLVS